MARTKTLAPLPRVTSKTITVGALLGKIKRLILAEPTRLNMDAWVSVFQGHGIDDVSGTPRPACGTVCCLAGWGAMLLRPARANGHTLARRSGSVMREAIGYDFFGSCSVGGLFTSQAQETYGESELPPTGTPEHATVIAKRIDTYLSQHPEIVTRKIVVADVQEALRA